MKSNDVWFVSANSGMGPYPINSRGWKVVYFFLFEVAVFVGLALWMKITIADPEWLWLSILFIGIASSGFGYIFVARSKSDFSVTYDEYIRRGRA